MGFRFRRSVRVLPGVRWNISGTGSSFSFGGRGLTTNIGQRGVRNTVGIPGSGVSYSWGSSSGGSGSPGRSPLVKLFIVGAVVWFFIRVLHLFH